MPPKQKPAILDPTADGDLKEVEIVPKPPPLPKPPRLQMESIPLIDIPCVFLNNRLCWPEFKRALTECGLSGTSLTG